MDASFIQDRPGPINTAPVLSLPGTSSVPTVAALLVLADGRVSTRVRRWLEWWRDDPGWGDAATGTGGYVG